MKDHELRQAIRDKNEAWQRLAKANRHCLAWQQVNHTPAGYDPLPGGWEERRSLLRERYRDARQRCMEILRRRK
jgi:hypothetical protein